MNIVVRGLCSNCEKETELELITKEEVVRFRNDPIKVEVQFFRCIQCGDEAFDPSLNVDPLALVYIEYRKKHGFLQPGEIRSWRMATELTQVELAKLLGLGVVTICRYENGYLQTLSHEKFLRLAMNPSNLLRLIEKSEGVLTEAKKKRLLRAIGGIG